MTGAAAGVNGYELTEKEKEYARMIDYKNNINDGYNYINSFAPLQKNMEMLLNFNDVYHKYYKLSLDFENQKQFDKENSYIKFKDIKDSSIKYFIKDKLGIPFLNDYTDIVIPQQDSRLVKTVYNSPEFKTAIKTNYEKIKNGEFKNKSFNFNFNKTKDAHLTLGNVTLYNMRIVDGYICGTLIDYYDFKYLDYYKDTSLMTTFVNNNAYCQQEYGQLKNYLIIFPIRIKID